MNGVHDMGGMQDMGPIQYEQNEPVFHAPWESRVFALNRAMRAWRKWNADASRYEREIMRPAEYLRNSYYENVLAALISLLPKTGMVTSAEVQSGIPANGSASSSTA